ncbi:MAG: hypothetical protein ACYTGQ_09280, partial [Planctomycetota bacterium]
SRRVSLETGEARLRTSGVRVGLRVGDRVSKLAGRGIGLGAVSAASSDRCWALDRVRHRWDRACSELQMVSCF